MRVRTSAAVVFVGVLVLAVASAFLLGQRAASGQSAGSLSSGAVPRMPNGKPSVEGIWQALNTANWDIQDHSGRVGVPAGQGVVEGNEIPYQDWALAKKKENFEKRAQLDPEAKCYMPGVPRLTYEPFPFQIAQSDDHVLIIYEYIHIHRLLFMDGSPHPDPEVIDFWMGDSRARWEGDTLVVDVRNFNDQTWFDRAGNFHSDALHVVERYRMLSYEEAKEGFERDNKQHNNPPGMPVANPQGKYLQLRFTVEDPNVFTTPWSASMTYRWGGNDQLDWVEQACAENLNWYPGKEADVPRAARADF